MDSRSLTQNSGQSPNVALDDVYYSFPVGERISAIIAANSVETDDFVTSTIVPYDGPAVADASTPGFYGDVDGGGDFGAGVNFAFTENVFLDLGYSSESSNRNDTSCVVFNESNYIAQLYFLTDGILDAAVTYIGTTDAAMGQGESAIAGLINLDFGGFQVAGHYANTDYQGGGSSDSYMGGGAFDNFLGSGNEFGIYGGDTPHATVDTVLLEAYYEVSVNEFFTFTPAVIYTDNDSGSADDTAVYGAVRATFKF